MKRKSVAVSLITVLLYMLLGSTIACAPSPVQTFYNLTLVARFGGELVYNIEGHTEDSDCPAGRVCMLIGVPRGQVVAITAVPDEGFAFADWTGDVDAIADVNAATIAITMSGNCTIVANFIREIRDWHDLDAIRENLDLNCVLISDLDSTTAGYEALAGPNANGGKGWEPIGTVATGENWMWYYPFTGSLDGRGYEIRDFFINRPEESHIGLFGYIREGVITDVGVVNVTVTGLRLVGGLVGWNEDGTVNNSYAAGSVTGNEYVGGLAGWNYYGTILGSYADGTVTGGWVVGGLVGYNSGNIDSCYSTGTVTGDDGIGGLVGGNDGGTITNCHATGTVTGYDVVGGLVGYNDGEIDSCHAIGDVTGTSDFNPDPPEDYEGGVGGLVGYNTGDIDASHATGSVTHTSWYTGGLVGQNWYGTVSNSYWESTGIVTGTRTVGGLIGYNTGTVDTCYADGEVFGYVAVGGLTGRTWYGNVIDSYSIGTVTGTHTVGGLLGGTNHGATIEGSYSTAAVTGDYADEGGTAAGGLVGYNYASTISDSYASGIVTGYAAIGGLVGANSGDVDGSYAAGSVTGDEVIGGLVGWNGYGGAISNSYAEGSVTGDQYVGGLVGSNQESSVGSCYSVGYVTGTTDIGGLVGWNDATVTNSFWDTQTSGQAASAGGTGRTTAQMRNITTFTGAGWDIVLIGDYFNETWYIDNGNDYPRLGWQYP